MYENNITIYHITDMTRLDPPVSQHKQDYDITWSVLKQSISYRFVAMATTKSYNIYHPSYSSILKKCCGQLSLAYV